MPFLNPKTDYAFKKIFGSDASEDILISLLNAILGLEGEDAIVGITILDPYLAPRIKGWKESYVDVRAVDGRGCVFIIEMQVLVMAGFEKRILYNVTVHIPPHRGLACACHPARRTTAAMGGCERILYNACKAYVGQIASAEHYRQLNEVIAITICDFVMYPTLADIISTFRLSAAESPQVTQQDMTLVFVELPKFTKAEHELASPLDRWLYFLKTAGTLETVPPVLAADPAIDHALKIANKACLSAEELADLERREQWIGMQKGMMLDAEEARRQGEATGRVAALLHLLRHRFKTVPARTERTLRTASIQQLDAWFHAACDAPSLEAIFCEPNKDGRKAGDEKA